MAQPWCGNVTVGQRVGQIEGTLAASLVGNEGERAPDVTMSFRWRPEANDAGYTGTIYSSGGTPGQGQHGSMGRSELRSILFARGPGFKDGLKVDAPSGNIDLAPTILKLLELPAVDGMEGPGPGRGNGWWPRPRRGGLVFGLLQHRMPGRGTGYTVSR